MGLEHVSSDAVYAGWEKLSDFIQNILIYVLEMNKSLTGTFLGELSL